MSQEPEQLDPGIQRKAEGLIEQAAAQFLSDEPDLSQVEDCLRRVLELLGDWDGTQAQDARSRAGKIWRTLVKNTRDVDRSEKLLKEGARLFSHLPPGESLGSMVWRHWQICGLKDALTVPPEMDWPEWFENPNAQKRLRTLLSSMDELFQETSWLVLQEQTEWCKGVLLEEYLPAYIVHLSEDAHRQARQGDFARASQNIEKALQFFPEELVAHIPASVDRQDLEQLKGAIEVRQRAEATLETAIVKIVEQPISISEVISEIDLELPDHPDVAVVDLLVTLSDLEKAAQIEGAYDEIYDRDVYQVYFHTLVNSAGFFVHLDPQTATRFQSILRQIREEVNNAPERALQQLVSELESHAGIIPQDISSLLKSYWYLVWFLEKDIPYNPDFRETAREALSAARRKPQGMLLRAVELFEKIKDEQGLNQFLQILSKVQVLNRGLARYPQAASNQSQSDMPPLQDGVKLPETEPQLSGVALQKWEEVANTWLRRSHEDMYPQDEARDREDRVDLKWLLHCLQEYQYDIDGLRDEVWPELDLPPWGQNSLPGKLETECKRFLRSAIELNLLGAELGSKSAVDGACSWEQHYLDSMLIGLLEAPVIWLLEPQRSGLVHHIQALKGEIKSYLEVEIRQILEGRPPSASQLRDRVLAANLTGEFALVARQIIEENVSSRVHEAQGRGDYEAALVVWEAVRQATHPWADQRVEPINQEEDHGPVWRDLNRRATWGYRKTLLLTHRRKFITGGVALLVMLVVLGFGGSALLGRAGDNSQMAVSAAATQTLIPTSTQDRQDLTVTAVLFAGHTATKQAADELTATNTAQARLTSTARREALLGQTATAQALQTTEVAENSTATAAAAPAFQATAAALRCLSDSSAYTFELVDGPRLNPDPGSLYVWGDSVYRATAMWIIQNTGECDWEGLSVEPYQDALQVNYFFWSDSEQIEVSSENPLEVGQTIKVYLAFPLLDARDIDEAWVLVANGVQIGDSPLLELDVEDWIITISPSSTPTPKPKSKPPTDVPEPTARPTEPPPTRRP